MKSRRKKPRLKLILNAPDRVSVPTKIGSGVFTVIFWALFIYLWVPLFTLVAWGLGIYHAYGEVRYAQELLNLRHLVFIYSIVVLMLCGSLLLWALKEYMRFRDSTRRRIPFPVESTELATYASLDENHIVTWQGLRRMVAHHDEHGNLHEIAIDTDSSQLNREPVPSVA